MVVGRINELKAKTDEAREFLKKGHPEPMRDIVTAWGLYLVSTLR